MRESISNSEGYVYFNKQRKKWNACYPMFDKEKKKDMIKTKSFETEREAKQFLCTIMYQRENPIYIKNNGIPFCEMMRVNARNKLETKQITEVTYMRTLQTIAQIEKYPIGKKNIDEIKPEELQTFLNSHENLSNSTLKKLYQQLNATFHNAINRGYLTKNPMASVIKPESEKEDKEVRALTFEEQKKFTDFLLERNIDNCKYKNVFLIQMFMGLRIGEVLALTISDIDLQNKRININKTLTRDERGNVIMAKRTKTYSGKRSVPIQNFIYDAILEQMEFSTNQPNNPEKLLFKPDYCSYTDRGNVNSELKRIMKKYFGITDITTHSLRHTFGTRCIEAGMAPVVVKKLMGHKDIRVTLNTYTSVYDSFKEKEIEKVNQYFLKENMVDAIKALDKLSKDEVKALFEGLEKKDALEIYDNRIKTQNTNWYDSFHDLYSK
ncbi:MAG: site-specific integrase [Clostridia bacterium]|nr:site-specific integrase [Clostridia bacterium]